MTALDRFLDPIRERRARFEAQPGLVDELIVTGTERTRAEVRRTLVEVRRAMGLSSAYTQVRRRAERYRKAVATSARRRTGPGYALAPTPDRPVTLTTWPARTRTR
ncbi:hypothetical protein GA0070215_1254 [Micromonospora marina]|uniref:Uncharacterized protein n=1 Tax=Micromonospora marina TaxID=307120 RepID=A0A1C5A786_9ACTN|nr:hypothetical protein [Micromonospora marina]SCF41016.1 hypothetical protein GA0070215_1254 [Micromonospora marina]